MASSGLPTTSLSTSVTTLRRRRQARQPAALDRVQVLAHDVDLVDGGAAAQQRVGRLLQVLERDAVGRQASAGPSRRPRSRRRPGRRSSASSSSSTMARVASTPAASGTGWLASRMRTARVGADCPYRTVTLPSTGTRSPSTSSTAAAIGAEALPAPTTSTRRTSRQRIAPVRRRTSAVGRPRASARRTAWPGSTAARRRAARTAIEARRLPRAARRAAAELRARRPRRPSRRWPAAVPTCPLVDRKR